MPSRLPGLLVAAALLATACADSGSPRTAPTSTTVPPMTKDAYVKAANAVCTAFNNKIEEVPEPKTADEMVTSLTSLLALMDQGNAALRKLNPPAEDRAEVEQKLLVPNEEGARLLREALPKIEAAAQADDEETAATEFTTVFGAMEELTVDQEEWGKDFGVTECTS